MGRPRKKGARTASKPAEPLVNKFAEQHGDYRRDGREGKSTLLVNRGGTPVARWITAKLLSDTQQAAIAHCQNVWEKLGEPSVTADWNRTPGAGHGDGLSYQEALDDHSRMKGYVPLKYWSVFESVCRDGEPAGFAGSRLSNVTNEQSSHARLCVQFVADVIVMKERLSYR